MTAYFTARVGGSLFAEIIIFVEEKRQKTPTPPLPLPSSGSDATGSGHANDCRISVAADAFSHRWRGAGNV